MSFLTAVDIGNRALQHCGVPRMDPTQGFTENSQRASAVSFCYDKLRQAELRKNVWRFTTRRAVLRPLDVSTMVLAPALWASSTTYFVGSLVSDENGTVWVSQVPDNLGNQPESSSTWAEYFGPLTVSLYDSTTTYFAGELVYTAAGDGTSRVYLSLLSGNSDNPATATAYDSTVSYFKDQVVTYSSVAYLSLIDLNINQTPSASAANWASGTTYALNALVNGSNGVTYKSLAGGNVGNDPVLDNGVHWLNTGALTPWTTVFTGGTGSLQWLQIGGAEFPMGVGVSTVNIVYPLGSGPSSQSTTRNAFRLPAGYLRTAPQDPKAGINPFLGAPSGPYARDWTFEGNFIVSSQGDPIVLRFVADTVDVSTMDALFCEALAAKIGMEVCEEVTQSTEKLKTIAALYKDAMLSAGRANGIETGPVEPPVDDFITCRL